MVEEKIHIPMVSVIIPCYNASKYLSESLDCIANQNYTEWECIVADDGSTDNSKEIVESFAGKDLRFKYVHQINAGPSAARNLGIGVAKGEFLQFLDSDDLVENDKLKRQVEIMQNMPDCDIVYGNMKYFSRSANGEIRIWENEEKDWKNGKVSGEGDSVIKVLLEGNIMVVDSPLIRKSVFEKIGLWDTEIWFNEDWDVWTRAALNGVSFHYDNSTNTDALVRYHEESRSRDLFKMFLHGLKVCLKLKKVIKSQEYRKVLIPKIYYHLNFLDKYVLSIYKSDKEGTLKKASELFKETQLSHYRIFAWLIHNLPIYFSYLYVQYSYLLNRIKSKILYES